MTPTEGTTPRPVTTQGRLLLASGLTFGSGRRLADHPELIYAIEEEAREAAEAALTEALALLELAKKAMLISGGPRIVDEAYRAIEQFLAAHAAPEEE